MALLPVNKLKEKRGIMKIRINDNDLYVNIKSEQYQQIRNMIKDALNKRCKTSRERTVYFSTTSEDYDALTKQVLLDHFGGADGYKAIQKVVRSHYQQRLQGLKQYLDTIKIVKNRAKKCSFVLDDQGDAYSFRGEHGIPGDRAYLEFTVDLPTLLNIHELIDELAHQKDLLEYQMATMDCVTCDGINKTYGNAYVIYEHLDDLIRSLNDFLDDILRRIYYDKLEYYCSDDFYDDL